MNIYNEGPLSVKEDNTTNYRRLFAKMTSNWLWFVTSILLCAGAAYLYIKYTTPLYKVTAKLMINDAKKGSAGESQILSDLGGVTTSSVENEAEVLKTRFLMEQVVRDMKLNVNYYKAGTLLDVELYDTPFQLDLVDPVDSIKGAAFDLKFLKNGKINIRNERLDTVVSFNQPFKISKIGVVQILNTGILPDYEKLYSFSIVSFDKAVEKLRSRLTVAVTNKQVSIIDLSITQAIPKKGEDILRKILQRYVQTNINDKNEVADSTIKFIQNRLSYLGGELGDLEGNIQGFKQKNQIAEMSEQSKLIIQNSSQFVNDLAKVETQINILSSIQQYLNDDPKGNRVLPSSLIVSDPMFTNLVEKYNSLLMERGRRLMGVTETNPAIVNMDQQITNLRSDMLASLNSSKNTLNISKSDLLKQMKSVEVQMREVPQIERDYVDLARQQKIKQELYIFLMQKGEEAAIAKTSNTSSSKNIDPPKSESSPISPSKNLIYLASLFIGLILPAVIIYIRFLLNNKIESKDDITIHTQVPVVGEISHNNDVDNLVVANNSRSAIAEQFRALRTNLSFYLKGATENTIMFTSSMSGEGKSFAAINLGNIMAISGKRVLLMELDLRKPGLSAKFGMENTVGFTNFILNEELKAENIIKKLDLHENLYIIGSGPIPPNPAEMLMSERTSALMAELKGKFDYIIIDAPPVGIVTDAQLMASYADICLYMVRQKYTFKSQLEIVEALRLENKMKRIGIVVNDIKLSVGYGYGYGYSYGYGYGYGDDSDQRGGTGILYKLKKGFRRK